MPKKIYLLDDMEEILILLYRIDWERHKVLFTHGEKYYQTAQKRMEKMLNRIEKLGGNPNAKLKIEVPKLSDYRNT